MQMIGLGYVVKYTYARGQVTKSEDMPRPDARGRGRGQLVEAEDKISASRTVWPRGLNITANCQFQSALKLRPARDALDACSLRTLQVSIVNYVLSLDVDAVHAACLWTAVDLWSPLKPIHWRVAESDSHNDFPA